MSDIVERLRKGGAGDSWGNEINQFLADEAADEIEALRRELYRTRVILGQMANAQREKASGEP